MKREIKEIINKTDTLYVNVHKDNIIRDTAKSIVVDLGHNESVYIPKVDIISKPEYFNYIKLYVDRVRLYPLTTTTISDKKWYEEADEVYLKLLNSNYKQNQFSKVLLEINQLK